MSDRAFAKSPPAWCDRIGASESGACAEDNAANAFFRAWLDELDRRSIAAEPACPESEKHEPRYAPSSTPGLIAGVLHLLRLAFNALPSPHRAG